MALYMPEKTIQQVFRAYRADFARIFTPKPHVEHCESKLSRLDTHAPTQYNSNQQ